MKIGFYNYYDIYNNNAMFNSPSSPIGDDLVYPFTYLYKYAAKFQIDISTIDTKPLEDYDVIIFNEMPSLKNKYFSKLLKMGFNNMYLIIFESEVTKPDNWSKENHKYFKKVFTWHDEWVDGIKYIKIHWPNRIYKNYPESAKSGLLTMISGNKHVSDPRELYTERINAIRWFEKHHIDKFDLYGTDWGKYIFKGILSRLNRFVCFRKMLAIKYPSYKGFVDKKKQILNKYKFSICYENAKDIPGYITEKIFDCFFSGCVPIYLGAPNISQYIPEHTFIDKNKFKTYDKLYQYINNMSDAEYYNYLAAIKNFIKSVKIYPFSAECFTETLLNEIVERSYL